MRMKMHVALRIASSHPQQSKDNDDTHDDGLCIMLLG
jgi:hypothetical protein